MLCFSFDEASSPPPSFLGVEEKGGEDGALCLGDGTGSQEQNCGFLQAAQCQSSAVPGLSVVFFFFLSKYCVDQDLGVFEGM